MEPQRKYNQIEAMRPYMEVQKPAFCVFSLPEQLPPRASSTPKAQHCPKALHKMVFGLKILEM